MGMLTLTSSLPVVLSVSVLVVISLSVSCSVTAANFSTLATSFTPTVSVMLPWVSVVCRKLALSSV